jgi:hypothetical protein
MNKLAIALVAAALTVVFAAPSVDASFYLIRNRDGVPGITNATPGYGWSLYDGPFATFDEAMRAVGTGTISDGSLRVHIDTPAKVPTASGDAFAAMAP